MEEDEEYMTEQGKETTPEGRNGNDNENKDTVKDNGVDGDGGDDRDEGGDSKDCDTIEAYGQMLKYHA